MVILSKAISVSSLDFKDYFKFGIFFVGRTPTLEAVCPDSASAADKGLW